MNVMVCKTQGGDAQMPDLAMQLHSIAAAFLYQWLGYPLVWHRRELYSLAQAFSYKQGWTDWI
jgi:hypothetical protein